MAREAIGKKGRFVLLDELGEGGFAKVWRARDAATNRQVALKVLKESLTQNDAVLERFRREVFAIASIQSPHVVALYDFGMSGDEFYIAMEYVEGPTLRDIIKEQVWTADVSRLVIGQTAQALSVAHHGNILHRDLKPENVMLLKTHDGSTHVKVLDFGFAKLAEFERELGSAPVTRIGSSFGTPHYMAPEQIRGKMTDEAIDLFALGVIAYEMLAGHRPWGGSDPYEVMRNVLNEPAPPIERLHPGLIARLDDVNKFFERVLAKDKSERPANAVEFFQAFDMALFGERAQSLGSSDPARAFASVVAHERGLKDGFQQDTIQMSIPAEVLKAAIAAAEASRQTGKIERLTSSWFQPLDLENLKFGEQTDPRLKVSATAPTPMAPVPVASMGRSEATTDKEMPVVPPPDADGGRTDEEVAQVGGAFAGGEPRPSRTSIKAALPWAGEGTAHVDRPGAARKGGSKVGLVIALMLLVIAAAAAAGFLLGRRG